MNPRPLAIVLAVIVLMLAAACGSGSNAPAPARPETDSGQAPPGVSQERDSSGRRDATAEQISTFALDVDTASYDYARRLLKEGERPEPARIRPEEFVNSFRQDYPEPSDNGFTVQVDGARVPGNGAALVRVGLRTRGAEAGARRPANLTFVVDVSGSMAEPGRLDLVREALHTLVGQLGAGDRVSLVAFSEEAEPIIPMTSASGRDRLHAAVDRLAVRGTTDLAAGLTAGYAEAARSFSPASTNRVILLSDGLANTGETSWRGILDRVADNAGRRITLLCVGVGHEYGDELMEQLADNGDGAAVYVSTADDARRVFAEQLAANLDLRARDAKAQVVFNPSTVESYRLVGYENRRLAAEDFRDDAADGGEVGPGHAVTALYDVRLREGAGGQLLTAAVRWQDPDTRAPGETSRSVETGDLAGSPWEGPSPRFQVDVVAAAFAEYLRAREPIAGVDSGELARQAARLATLTEDAAVRELADLIGRATSLG
ncbi:vWA domain-containing protein [Streptosporangium pseudovulgare]|uniref:VWFA domain-containing protein n=1 Tax=Streptosporangium pseudovulgare TaxID=35765 RepID=A0ABQ2QKM5_9ACTN|nr:von Willebrand factor type A domain-containing protein [Streptosporangium pseudovulgare]GGP86153.1 hypothetical protein GCM10010140_14480 [Streptosporangium pseudovulgare]